MFQFPIFTCLLTLRPKYLLLKPHYVIHTLVEKVLLRTKLLLCLLILPSMGSVEKREQGAQDKSHRLFSSGQLWTSG